MNALSYEDCRECIGSVCERGCKADARSACISPVLAMPTCLVLDHCEVDTLAADAQRVNLIRASRHGRPVEVRARIVVLSAGAMHSPQILLRSRNEFWPNGIGNRSDQVGRNLMFHTCELYAVWAPRRYDRQGRQKKALSIRDFYVHNGQRLGYIQSMGLNAGHGSHRRGPFPRGPLSAAGNAGSVFRPIVSAATVTPPRRGRMLVF